MLAEFDTGTGLLRYVNAVRKHEDDTTLVLVEWSAATSANSEP
ncbi:hypothetical protein OG777_04830 [Micromonospora peucetia]|uniref:Uncharacterized protein n=1 Tax=Micromonospora peucetia TaxID=47871 RepID=A0ABZ1EFI6_9ACTN|nr:hypothetical protein [Micromonospora peucetia]MCX4386252.1 hypothetical protein [Micromonospora peucetia]WSA33595.1 hypothetical protein OIE14_05980 [Micromonospora peucetia]